VLSKLRARVFQLEKNRKKEIWLTNIKVKRLIEKN